MVPLTPAVFHILLALADGDKHGYAIMQEVSEVTDGAVRMGPGTLYGSLDRMLEARLIAEAPQTETAAAGPQRRMYRLSSFGGEVLAAETARLAQAVKRAREKNVRMGRLVPKPGHAL
jgi:DNA-binding PadR family transcriptional regulator